MQSDSQNEDEDATSQVQSAMDIYKDCLNRYRITLQTTEGCGERANGYIQSAHAELTTAHQALSEAEKKQYPLPKIHLSRDDGTGGFSSGMAALASMYRR